MLVTMSGQELSKFCFGTMQFGHGSNYDQSGSVYTECRQSNINHFDTAHTYTGGLSETWLGEFLKGEREQIFVSSKVGYTGGSAPKNLSAQLSESRKRLKQDTIDLLYLHRFDPDTPLEKTLTWFSEQLEKKTIRYCGVSNFAAWQITKAEFIAQKLGLKISAAQPMYSLVKRQAEVEIFPACQDLNIECFSYSPLGAGLLTGKYQKQTQNGRLANDARYAKRYGNLEMHKTATALNKLSNQYSVDPATLAVAWIAKSKYQPVPIVSARNTKQLTPVLNALNFDMSDELFDEINNLAPKPAPATDRLEEQV
jgi:aryl-alcohol dehydrogenase-like predicted oxidoreductase